MYTTTLNKIREHDPCADGWRKLLDHLGKTEADDEPLPLLTILDSNGLDEALWALRAMPEHAAEWRLLGCDYAERVLHLFEYKHPSDARPRRAIEVARLHAAGQASDEELAAARAAVWGAGGAAVWGAWGAAGAAVWGAWAAARAAARAAAWAAWAAADAAAGAAALAAGGAAEAAELEWQEERLREVLNEEAI